jgi:dephospho-CoA kinase
MITNKLTYNNILLLGQFFFEEAKKKKKLTEIKHKVCVRKKVQTQSKNKVYDHSVLSPIQTFRFSIQ